jgi:hypothetical protein
VRAREHLLFQAQNGRRAIDRGQQERVDGGKKARTVEAQNTVGGIQTKR